jgi:polar amino acid transport system ATP-binding protein
MASTEPIIQIRNISKFFGSLRALDNVSLDVEQGEKVVIIRPSSQAASGSEWLWPRPRPGPGP